MEVEVGSLIGRDWKMCIDETTTTNENLTKLIIWAAHNFLSKNIGGPLINMSDIGCHLPKFNR